MISTDIPILPEVRSMYDEMLELALIICKRARRDSNFALIDRKADIVGCMSIDLSDLSDHDLACDQDGETSWCAS
jgi:hypothetical protein